MNGAELAARDVPPESVGAAAELLARLVGVYRSELLPDAVAVALGELLTRKHRAGLRD